MNVDVAMNVAGRMEGLASNLRALGQSDLAHDLEGLSIRLRQRIDTALWEEEVNAEAF